MIAPAEKKFAYVDRVLGPEGVLSKKLSAFESRPQQLEMARGISRSLSDGRHFAVEAGTGVGKSFAYLVNAVRIALRKEAKTVISTHTINLQQQLINKDIPILAEILEEDFTACLAKGRNNYLCLRRLEYAKRKHRTLFSGSADEISQIAQWAKQTEEGSLSDLPFAVSASAWDAVMSEHGNCRGRACGNFARCFYRRARRQLDTADIIVANHSLLFSDLVLKENSPRGILPNYKHIMIDEAHNIERVAEGHFGIEVSSIGFKYLLDHLYNPRTKKGLLAFTDETQAVQLVRSCRRAGDDFFKAVEEWYHRNEKQTGGRCEPSIVPDNITEHIKQLRLSIAGIYKKSDDADDKCEYERYIDRCRDYEMQIKDFLGQPKKETDVYWIEAGGKRRKRILLRSAPVNVGPDVKRCLFDKYEAVIMTSATLSCQGGDVKEGFDFFASRIGLDNFDSETLGSPFDYENKVTIYIEADLPGPNAPDFEQCAASTIKKYLLQTGGRAFVLFTSYAMMNSFADRLTGFCSENGITLYVQGRELDRSAMLEEFKADDTSVLFGTDSFWQGVDVPGESLSNVIIVRLPFAVPNHPLTRGRIEHISAEGQNPFYRYQLPTAILKFKQGFGRLIRTHTDSGIIVILDSRIVHKPYGRNFLTAVPKARIEIVSEKI